MIVLDTHVWLWWLRDSPDLSPPARAAIEETDRIGISPLTCWEIGMLAARGRIRLHAPLRAWLAEALALPKCGLVPVSAAIAARATEFGPALPGDPADRLITASAVEHAVPLVTADARIRASGLVRTIW